MLSFHLINEDRSSDEDEEGGEHVLAERVRFKQLPVKLTQSHGRRVGENSYVLHAFDVGPDGKLDRKMLTEYKIDNFLSLGSFKMPL